MFSMLVIGTGIGFADDFESIGSDQGSASVIGSGEDSADFEDQDSPPESELEQEEFMKKLNQELNISKSEYYQITKNIRETRSRIESLKDEMSDLQGQLGYFDDEIAKTTEKLFTVIRQVVRKENEIKILYEEIDIKETALKYQKALLKDYIRQLYVYGDEYLEVSENGEIDAFKLLLADGNTGDVLKEIKYLGVLEETGDRLVGRLDELTTELLAARDDLEEKKASLEKLEKELTTKKDHLSSQRAAKDNLIALTRNQDEIYRLLLQQSLEEQQEALAEMQAFRETIEFIEQKIEEEGDAFDISQYADLIDKKFMTLYEFQAMPASGDGMIWPVLPERGISAYFHDPSYKGYFGMQHNAIDIRAGQGTPILAAADGVVYKAKDNDYGYSYIIVAHHNEVMTTYGHVSNIMVEEGQVIAAGDIVGLSGGMPGTRGAGYMTTGPHLHFEVMQNGAYVDALRFLPLEVLTAEHIEELPDTYLDDWEMAILGRVGRISK
jgi:murein DD-endopeptidase MepM/ murein hydrolase activator NlpD